MKAGLWSGLVLVMVFWSLTLAGCVRPAPDNSEPDEAANAPALDFTDPDVGGGIVSQDELPTLSEPEATATAVPATLPATITNTPPTEPATAEPEAPTATPVAETAAPPPTPTPTEAASTETAVGERSHVVQPGENLFRIGLQYGLSWVALAQYNGLSNPNDIRAGQTLIIPPQGETPSPSPTTPPSGNITYYEVQTGDNLFRIGQKFGISWVQIAEANGLVNPNQIVVGQTLKIPANVPGPTPEFTHVVKQGETIFRIAVQYGVPWTTIAEVNDIASPYVIYAGQTLIIPGSSGG